MSSQRICSAGCCDDEPGLIEEHFNFCPVCGAAVEEVELDPTVTDTLYLHSDKSSLCCHGEEIGLTDKALENFMYTLYEVAFEVTIDTETGKVMAHAITSGGTTVNLEEPLNI